MSGFEHDHRHAGQRRRRLPPGSTAASAHAASEHPLLALQQAAGNVAVASALQRKPRPGAFDPSSWPRLWPNRSALAGLGALTKAPNPEAVREAVAQPADLVRDAAPPAARELLEESKWRRGPRSPG